MPASFAALETRVNAAVIARLSNREVQYTPVAGLQRVVVGIFDAQYAQLLDDLAGAATPALTCASSDVPDATNGAGVVVDGQAYEVVEPMPDGAGLTVLRLRKAD